MFEYTITCTDPNVTEVLYIYVEPCKEIIETEYYESI
jgi:hypothetical protein|tara:strand:- start:3253 stop:3363 length:111 start_codon:yes stop_codon:yes gene_type:complete